MGRGGTRSSMFNNGGGFHLMGGAVGVNTCDSEDSSFYCQLSRFTGIINMIFSLFLIIVILYFLAKYFVFNKTKNKNRYF